MVIAFANIGGIISGQLYFPLDQPLFIISHSINLSVILVSAITSTIIFFCLIKENRKLKNLEENDDFKYVL